MISSRSSRTRYEARQSTCTQSVPAGASRCGERLEPRGEHVEVPAHAVAVPAVVVRRASARRGRRPARRAAPRGRRPPATRTAGRRRRGRPAPRSPSAASARATSSASPSDEAARGWTPRDARASEDFGEGNTRAGRRPPRPASAVRPGSDPPPRRPRARLPGSAGPVETKCRAAARLRAAAASTLSPARGPCHRGRGRVTRRRWRRHGLELTAPSLWILAFLELVSSVLPPCRPLASRKPPTGSPTSCGPCLRVSSTGSSRGWASASIPPSASTCPSQVARALVSLPELRDPSRLNPACVELMHRVAEARGSLLVASVPPALEPLLARGLMFARASGDGRRAHPARRVPRAAQGLGRRGPARHARAPLAGAVRDDERHRVALPRSPCHPSHRAVARDGVGRAGQPAEARARRSASCRRPSAACSRASRPKAARSTPRSCSSSNASPCACARPPARRPRAAGVGFSLERRALLIPVHPNRHVVPTEVSAIIGAAHHDRARRAARRGEALRRVGRPRARVARASRSIPSPLAMGVAVAARESSARNPEGRTAVGRVRRRARRGGHAEVAGAEARRALRSRAVARGARSSRCRAPSGCGTPRRPTSSAPPGQLHAAGAHAAALRHVAPRRRVGRGAHRARGAPPGARVARLEPRGRACARWSSRRCSELGEGRWVPWSSLAGWLTQRPPRARASRACCVDGPSASELEPVEPMEVARRIVHESLPALGIVDLGEDEDLPHDPAVDGEGAPVAPCASPRAAARCSPTRPRRATASPRSSSTPTCCASACRPAWARSSPIAPFVEVGPRGRDARSHRRAADARARAVGRPRGRRAAHAHRGHRSAAGGALAHARAGERRRRPSDVGRRRRASSGWRTRTSARCCARGAPTQELFVDPSPPGGLLVAAGVDLDRLARRCRTIGVEILVDGQVVRARTMPPPASVGPACLRRAADHAEQASRTR